MDNPTHQNNNNNNNNQGGDISSVEFLRRQQQVHEWIQKVLNEPIELRSENGVDDLAHVLKNGVLLCRLMLAINERSIPRYHKRAQTNAQVRENLFLFITACEDYHVPKHKLFVESDLTDNKNFVKVIECLEALAKLACSNGFVIPIEQLKDDEVQFSGEMITKTERMLKRTLTRRGGVSMLKMIIDKQAPTVANRQLNLFISSKGEDGAKVENGVSRLQAVFRGNLDRKRFQRLQRNQAFRVKVAQEILQTEEVYVRNLKALDTVYKTPLVEMIQKKKGIVTQDQVKAIFSELEIILGYNSAWLEDLRPRVQNWSPSQCLGDIFLIIINYLKVYTAYVQNYDLALLTLSECKKKSSKFEEFLHQGKQHPDSHGHDIEALLILPIQRIPRYNLLLNEMLKYTEKDHKDYAKLEEAQGKMKGVAEYVNEKKREFENIAKVREIQNSFEGKAENLIDPSRKFIRSDLVAVWSGSNDTDKKHNELVLTLFNDLIVVSSQSAKRGTLKFKEGLRIDKVSLREPKLRKWSMKMNDMGKIWPTPARRESFSSGSDSNKRDSMNGDSRRSSVNDNISTPSPSSRRNSIVSNSGHYSMKNTVELMNSNDETVLKVCFDTPLAHAGWIFDFKKVKAEREEIKSFDEKKALERAQQKLQMMKNSIENSSSHVLLKTAEERKQDWKLSSTKSSSVRGSTNANIEDTTEEKQQ